MPRLIQSIVILLLTFNFDGHAFAADTKFGVSQFYDGEQLLSGLNSPRLDQRHTLARGYIQGVADSFNGVEAFGVCYLFGPNVKSSELAKFVKEYLDYYPEYRNKQARQLIIGILGHHFPSKECYFRIKNPDMQ